MKILKMDGKRAFLNSKFVLIVLAVALLWYLNSRRFSVYEDVLAIFFASVGRSTITYITITVCTAVYGLSVCEDIQDYEIRNILCRIPLGQYVLSKIIICIVGSIAAYCLGTLLYIGYEWTQHPLVISGSITVENLRELTSFHVLLPEHTLGFIMLQIFLNGVCCSCMAVVSMALSIYMRDGFLVLCFPIILFYILLFFTTILLDLSTDTESLFWIITAEQPCHIFLLIIFLYASCFYLISFWLLYTGVKRYEYE